MKKAKIIKNGDRFDIVYTEIKTLDKNGLETYRNYVKADLEECKRQQEHLKIWEQELLNELTQIETLLGK